MDNNAARINGTRIAVTYREVLQRTIIVNSNTPITPEEAKQRVQKLVENTEGEFFLDCDDVVERGTALSDLFTNGIVPEDRDTSYFMNIDYNR